MREQIGVIGLGRMGSALATRAVSQGFSAVGWSRSGGDAEHAQQAGYTLLSSMAEVVAQSDLLLLSLFDDSAVEAVLTQLAQFDLDGKLIVETSTISPALTRRMEHLIVKANGQLIDAPISGGPEMVLAGTCGLFIGGDDLAVDRFMPLAQALSNRVAHVGTLGTGGAAKIVNNTAMAGAFRSACDAICLGEKMGLDLNTMMGFLQNSPAITPAFKSRIPMMLGQDDTIGFAMDAAVKDAGVFLAEAKRLGYSMPAVVAFSEAIVAAQTAGLGEKDIAAVLQHMRGR